ncbi:hypothetical protein [Pontibacter liquoris]|uniref:hypothetical protein n=1 Tax=Pontibacter liquoris TaxID=2905677 RepID=UPI001FA7A431|nr:hypothetical protein [Pontibacter liquoris]
MDSNHTLKAQKTNSTAILLLLLSIAFLAPGKLCAQKGAYTPPALIMPLHAQKETLHASLGIGRGYDLHLSYAVSNHLAVFATGTLNSGRSGRISLFGDKIYYDKEDYGYTGGLGYFWKPAAGSSQLLETYIGAGRFHVDSHRYYANLTSLLSRVRTDYWHLFWQFNAGWRRQNNEMALAARLSYLKYNDVYYEDDLAMYKPNVVEGLWGMNLDPAMSYSYLWRNFKFNGQLGVSLPLFKVAVKETRITYFLGDEVAATEAKRQHLGVVGLGRFSVQYTFGLNRTAN